MRLCLKKGGASEMALTVDPLAAKPEYPRLILGTYVVEGEI